MHNLFSTFIFFYGSVKSIGIGHCWTELQSVTDCPFLYHSQSVDFPVFTKYGNIQNSCLTPEKEMNILIYVCWKYQFHCNQSVYNNNDDDPVYIVATVFGM